MEGNFLLIYSDQIKSFTFLYCTVTEKKVLINMWTANQKHLTKHQYLKMFPNSKSRFVSHANKKIIFLWGNKPLLFTQDVF